MIKIGIDAGSSMTKLISTDEKGQVLANMIINKSTVIRDLDIFLDKEKIKKEEISKIIITGVGIDETQKDIYNIETIRVDEFEAVATGALYLANKKEALIVSAGTGTALLNVSKGNVLHLGGTGVGGGTLKNLCKQIANVNDFEEIKTCIEKGSLKNIDLTIQDITTLEIKDLPKDTTSSNFGKLNDKATKEDLVLGIANMIFETIGMMAVFATKNTNNKDIIVVGNITTIPYINIVLKKIEKLHNVNFIIPKQAEFATVIGAIKLLK